MRRVLSVCVGLLAGLLASAPASADLLVAPTRLVFEDGSRHGEFILVNKGDQSERYRISLANRRMSSEGRVVPADLPREDECFATDLIRFSPRTIVLPPDEPQTVRIMVRNVDDRPPGECRSHLSFVQVPDLPPAAAAPGPSGGRGLEVRIKPLFGITVPLIVRHGRLSAGGALHDLELDVEEGEAWLRLRMSRDGERSLFGDFTVRHELPGEEPIDIGASNSVALYTPNRERPVAIRLPALAGRLPRRGRIVVEYRNAERGADGLIAKAVVELPRP